MHAVDITVGCSSKQARKHFPSRSSTSSSELFIVVASETYGGMVHTSLSCSTAAALAPPPSCCWLEPMADASTATEIQADTTLHLLYSMTARYHMQRRLFFFPPFFARKKEEKYGFIIIYHNGFHTGRSGYSD